MFERPIEAQCNLENNQLYGGNFVHTYKFDQAANHITLYEKRQISIKTALGLYTRDQNVKQDQIPKIIENSIFVTGPERDLQMMRDGERTVASWESFLNHHFNISLEDWCRIHKVQYDNDILVNTCLAAYETGLSPTMYQG